MADFVEYRILGPLEVVENGASISLGGARQRALLAVLILHANEVVSRDRLIDELYGDEPPETAATAVQVHISHLRKLLGRDVIATRGRGYILELEDQVIDLARFEELVDGARDRQPSEAATRLREALNLWRGEPLADLDHAIARPERARLEELRLTTLEQRIAADLALGRHVDLVPELEGRVREHPLRERLRGQLMLALYRSGRQADALDVYREGRRFLGDELGLEPGDELRRLERAILEQDPAIGGPPPTFTERLVDTAGRRRKLLLGASGVLLAAAAGALGFELIQGGPAAVKVVPNSVAVVDPTSKRVVADVPVGGRPISMAVGAGAVWVVNGDNGTLVRIDPGTRETSQVGIGGDVSDVTVSGGSVWVAGGNSGTLTRVDPDVARGGVPVKTLWKGGEDALVARPVFFVASNPNGGLWASKSQSVVRVDPRSNAVLERVQTARPPAKLAVGGGNTWVATYDDRLERIDARSGTVTARVQQPRPESLAVYRGSVWMTVFPGAGSISTASGQVWQLDADSLGVRSTTPVPSGEPGVPGFAIALTTGEGAVWTVDKFTGVVWRVDPVTSDLTRVAGGIPYESISIAAGFGALWVGVQESG